MAATIGIKIANGEFYPIVEEYSPVKKRLVLTTVHDKQPSVQIDLYRSISCTMADAQYIGSLLMENIKPCPKGDPSIELIITSTKNGEIRADATDLDPSSGGDQQSLNISLSSLDEYNQDDEIPDFELDSGESIPRGLYERAGTIKEENKKFPWLMIICIALIVTALGLAVWLLLLRSGVDPIPAREPTAQEITQQAPPAQEPQVQTPPAQTAQPAVPAPAAPPPVIQAPATAPVPAPVQRTRNPPVASYRVPAVIPREGVLYTIRWGDTLWDIAEAFYRNPWLYPHIARFNNIPNPDRIIAGRTIRVPPRN